MKKSILITLLSFVALAMQAQQEKQSPVGIIARSYNDHIVLRFFPKSITVLQVANANGYTVERAQMITGANVQKLSYTAVKGSPFKRMQEQDLENELAKSNGADSTERNLTGLVYGITDPAAAPQAGDVLENGIESLKKKKDEDDMKYMMVVMATSMSKTASKGLALWVEDNDVSIGQTYVYRVKLNNPKMNLPNEWQYINVKCEKFNENYLRSDKAIKLDEGDTKITFSFPESTEYFAFNVERSIDGGKKYESLTNVPSIKLKPVGNDSATDYVYADSNLINYKKYYYRVLVSTPFADKLVLSEFSAMPRDKTPPPAPFLKTAEHIKPKEVKLTWEMDKQNLSDLKGFTIKRSSKNEGPYAIISNNQLPANTRTYIDKSFDSTGQNYYIVEAFDTANNKSVSFSVYVTLIDSTPPAIPVIAKAIIDSVGKITITIKPNTEKDFMGYQLLKANESDHEFSIVEDTYKDSLGATTFTLHDSTTLKSLTPYVYYKLIAFDTHYNQSESSKIIELKRPDTIPPVSPIIKNFKLSDSSITILFANSSSVDVVSNYLLRREVNKEKFDTVFVNKDNKVVSFTDTKFTGGKQYEYTMIAKDDSKLISKKSRSIIINTIANNKVPTPVIQAVYNPQQKAVVITYKTSGPLKTKKATIEIYKRKSKEADWAIFKTVELDVNKSIIDDKLDNSASVFYIAKIVDENKNSSNFSKPVEAKIN